ncbi:MAG: hypothetical protein QM736_17765 [Vicinamibacterales bacterium]
MNARKAWKLALGMVTAGAAVTMAVAPSLRAQAPTTADITYTKDIAPTAALVRELSSSERRGPDAAHQLR